MSGNDVSPEIEEELIEWASQLRQRETKNWRSLKAEFKSDKDLSLIKILLAFAAVEEFGSSNSFQIKFLIRGQ